MQSKRITKYLVAVLGCLVLGLLTLTGISFFPRGSQSSSADTTTTTAGTQYLTVKKVFVVDNSGTYEDSETTSQQTLKLSYIEGSETDVAEGDFVVLDTTRKSYYDEKTNITYTGREAISIYFGGTKTSKGIPVKSISLNGKEIQTNYIDEDKTTDGKATFSQYLFALTPAEVLADNLDDYYYTYNKDGTQQIDSPEGKYSVQLQYFDAEVQGEISESISFYILTQNTYSQPNENPTLNDTEKLNVVTDTNETVNTKNQMTAKEQYFNFNNVATTYYNTIGNQNKFSTRSDYASHLYYPTLIYDAKKFDVSYTRTLYNYRETVTTEFSINKSGSSSDNPDGLLTISTTTTADPTTTIRRYYKIPANANGNYTVKLQFDRVGEYQITKTPKLFTGYATNIALFATPTSSVIATNEEYFQTTSLIINGYTATYSDTESTSAPLYNDTYSYNTMEGEINTTPDVIYTRDFLTAYTEQQISATEQTRAETIYTADMTFANTNFVSNVTSSTITTQTLNNAYLSVDPEQKKYKDIFAFIESAYIKQSAQNSYDNRICYTQRASTNLAPVRFEFYGALYTGNSSNIASWYAFRDTSGNVSINKFTNSNSTFSEAGEYVIYLTYKNVVYSGTSQIGSCSYEYMHQILCFEITNNTPTISVLAEENFSSEDSAPTMKSSIEDAETISIDSFTNKYVYASWEAPGPFDAGIYCTYNVTYWNADKPSTTNAQINGLVYQTNPHSKTKYDVSTDTTTTILAGERARSLNNTMKLEDGHYQIQVFRTNNSKAWVNFTFNIDTAPIDGIKALAIANGGTNLETEDLGVNAPKVLSALTDSVDEFNLVTKSAFGYTWNDKKSGAQITAKYVYASITKTTNFDLVKAITGSDTATETAARDKLFSSITSDGAVYMPTNAVLGDFSPAIEYNKIVCAEYVASTKVNSSQIINTPQLAFLLLRDEAGNTAIFATMLDNTNTQVLQVEKQSSYVNVITKDTEFYWGTHKSIQAKASSAEKTEGLVRDIYDLAENIDTIYGNETLFWTLNGTKYSANSIFTNAFQSLNVDSARSINIPLEKVTVVVDSIGGSESTDTGTYENITIEPTIIDSSGIGKYPKNWYSIIKVNPGAKTDDPYTTWMQTGSGREYKDTYMLEPVTESRNVYENEILYTIATYDTAGNDNAGGLNVTVNLDKSLGSLRSYYEYAKTLDYNRNVDVKAVTDCQYVPNTYSTNRRYVAFSWTEPSGGAYYVNTIVLSFYTFAPTDTTSANYPYSETASKTITLYSRSDGYTGLSKITDEDYGDFYLTDILMKLNYSADFSSEASEPGKYVITRTYTDGATAENLEGDVMTKTYTYYIDRNDILPTTSYTYGDETLQFGYNKGDYTKYPTYPENGSITFDNFGLITTTDSFDKLTFAFGDRTAPPSKVIVESNILRASVNMSTWTDSQNYIIYDKYYPTTSAESAIKSIQEILTKYKNSSRLQVAVQYFAKSGSTYSTGPQIAFYSTRYDNTTLDKTKYENDESRPLSDLQYAFKDIGRYRVLLFDLANFDSSLTGNFYTDFRNLRLHVGDTAESSSTNSKNNLFPNCSIINFELTGVAPTFNYQASSDTTSYGPLGLQSNGDIITNNTKSRVTWSDSSDIYTARNAYNEVSVYKYSIPKGIDATDVNLGQNAYSTYYQRGSAIETRTIANPIEITYSETVAEELTKSGLICIGLSSQEVSKVNNNTTTISALIQEKLQSSSEENIDTTSEDWINKYFIKVANADDLNTLINHGVTNTSLESAEYYKVRQSDSSYAYDYYLLLPRASIEDNEQNKLVDTKYIVTIHYIAKDSSDYIINGLIIDNKVDKEGYYSKTSTMYLDYTAPYYNLANLIKNDPFLSSLGSGFQSGLITKLDDPESTFLKSYAFAVSAPFTLTYQNIYESSSAGYYYYYRGTNYSCQKGTQTVTQYDENYKNAPQFVSTDSKFQLGTYAGIRGKDATELKDAGYYDIIEQDTAGNLRVYTIYITDNNYSMLATNGDVTLTTKTGITYNSAEILNENHNGFKITKFNSNDKWVHFVLTNLMSSDEKHDFYLITQDVENDIPQFNKETTTVCYNTDDLIDAFNSYITSIAIAHNNEREYGSQIQFSVDSRINSSSQSFLINTQGKQLISDEAEFLSLTTLDSTNSQFTLRLPDTTGILSTKLYNTDAGNGFEAYKFENTQTLTKIDTDSYTNLLPNLPGTEINGYENTSSINEGFTFKLSNNIVYRFIFRDNFGRVLEYTYPVDSALVKELKFSGGVSKEKINGHTYTSNDVDFVYQENAFDIALTITDLNTTATLYTKNYADSFNLDQKYFSYIKDSLTSNVVTLRFNATRGLNILVEIKVNNGNSEFKFDFVLYTVFPQIIVSDENGSPIQNYLTSKNVMLSWDNVEAEFNPYVVIIRPDGTREAIETGFTATDEGTYTVRCVNDFGDYISGQIVFTIKEYIVSIYGVYQILSSGQTVQLTPFTDNYNYTTSDNKSLQISQYLFLSNESNWDRNITILLNEDKDLICDKNGVKTSGNTRIYRVYGKEKGLYQLEIYFAVTRIPTYNVDTKFHLSTTSNGHDETTDYPYDSTYMSSNTTTLLWNTTYLDTSDPNSRVTYDNFYTLNLEFNGTFVGSYTSSPITLTNTGIYTISIVDPVGQKQYFGKNSPTFTLTILKNVIYYVNNNAGIPYATYSDPVDFYVPSLDYYDTTPTVTIYRNNVEYAVTPNSDGHYIFSTPGSYRIVMKTSSEKTLGTIPEAQFEATHQFVIVSPNEALKSYNFTAISGYEIINVVRLDTDTNITDEIRGDATKITTLSITPENLGVGKYQITVRTEAVGYNPSQTYTFSIWINDQDVVITPSRNWGSSSRSGFTITANTAIIYNRIGECQIVVNGNTMLTINESNKDAVDPTTLNQLTEQGDYIVQLISASGTVLQSYRMTIQEPLNTAAIILIIVGILVVITLIIVFIIMRKKVRVR